MKIGSSYFMRKTLGRSKRKQPSGTAPSRCFPKHTPFFLPKCVFSASQRTAHDPLLFIHAQLQISKPVISFPFFLLNLPFLWSVSGIYSTNSIVFLERIWLLLCLWFKGLWLAWQRHLKGQLVNNLNQHIDQGILKISMPPRWIYKIHLNWEIIINVWWNLC